MNLPHASQLPETGFADTILSQSKEISRRLDLLRMEKFPPDAKKSLRHFPLVEAARFVGVSPSYLKKLHLEGRGPDPALTPTGRRIIARLS